MQQCVVEGQRKRASCISEERILFFSEYKMYSVASSAIYSLVLLEGRGIIAKKGPSILLKNKD